MTRVLAGALVVAAVYWLILFLVQRSILFPAPADHAAARPPDARQIWLSTGVGRTEAWYLPSRIPGAEAAPLLLFAHGNAELIDFWPAAFDTPRAWGLGILLVEYPGYGRSAGAPTATTIRQTFEAAYDWAAAQTDIDPRRIVLYGRSVGGAAVAPLSLARPAAALILESSFTTTTAFAWRFLAPPFLVRDRFDNVAAVRQFRGPKLILHGDHDEIIPTQHGRLLAQAAGVPLVLMPCGHNDCQRPWRAVYDFLVRAGLVTPPHEDVI